MAIQIGIIKAIIGSATATSADGSIRNLQAGDAVFQNDLITTGAASAVEIEFTDGSVMDLGRNSQAMLDLDVFDPTAPITETTETTDVPDDVAALQEALLAGADVSQLGEATAAGAGAAGGEEGGHSFVVRDYLGPEVIPDNGFDTTGPSIAFENPEELNLILVEEEVVDDTPSTDPTTGLVDEDDLGSEFELAFVGPSAIVAAFELDTGFNAQFPFVFGNNDEAGGDDLPPDSSTTINGVLNASFGSNGPGAAVFNPTASQPVALTSGGEPVQFWVSADGAMLVGYIISVPEYEQEYGEYAQIIFTAELDPLTLDYQFTLHGRLDHADISTEDNLLVNLSYQISDSDGDTADGILAINVDDDSPLVELFLNQQSEAPLSIVVDESVGIDGSVKDEPGFAANDDETDSADETDIGYAVISGDVLFNVNVSPGADGEDYAARSFALNLALAEGETEVDSGLDATDGGNIMLSMDGDDIVGMDGDTVVFRISIDAESGDVTVSQYAAIDHGEDDNDHDAFRNIDDGLIGANVTVYDNDGDSATSNDVDLGSLIGFEDDGPSAAIPDTDLLDLEGVAALDESLESEDGVYSVSINIGAAFSGMAAGDFGSDGEGDVSYAVELTGGSVGSGLFVLDPEAVDGKGGEIMLVDNGDGTVSGMAGMVEVFTISIDESGELTFAYAPADTLDPVNIWHGNDADHDDAALLDTELANQLVVTQTITDGDGDSATSAGLDIGNGEFFAIEDDGPSAAVPDPQLLNIEDIAVLDESLESDDGVYSVSINVSAAFSGMAAGDFGTDGAGDINYAVELTGDSVGSGLFVLDTGEPLGKGDEIMLVDNGDGTVSGMAGMVEVFTLSIDEFGELTFEYFDQTDPVNIWHGDTEDHDDAALLQTLMAGQLVVTQTITDADGDSVASAGLDIGNGEFFAIEDDGPVALPDSDDVTEGALLQVNEENGVLSNDDAGTDGGLTIVGVAAGNDTSEPVTGNVGMEINGEHGTLTLYADGSYDYQSTANAIGEDEMDIFVYTVVDADGDTATTTLTINLANIGLVVDDDDEVIVNEAALDLNEDGDDLAEGTVTGSNPASTAETYTTGDLSGNVTGGVGPYSFVLLDAAIGTYGQIQLNLDGTYTYTLTSPVDGPDADNGTNIEDDAESFSFEVTDANGNTGTGTIFINIIDDVPTAVNDTPVEVTEGDVVGEMGNVLDNDTEGADGAMLTHVDVGEGFVEITDGDDEGGGDFSFDVAGVGVYTFNADGSWSFVPVASVDNTGGDVDASFNYRITDGDGDTDEALQPIDIADGEGPEDAGTISLTVDEDDLLDGSDATKESLSDADTLTFVLGSDALASIAFDDDLTGLTLNTDGLAGDEVVWEQTSDTEIVGKIGGVTVITLTLSANLVAGTAQVTATLSDNFMHLAANGENVLDLGSVDVIATDIDGDTATGTVNVSVVDDVPQFTLVNDGPDGEDIVSISAFNPPVDTVYEGQFAEWSYGADGFGEVNLTLPSNVQVASVTESQIVLNLYEGDQLVGILTLNADGTDSLEVLRREPEVEFIPVATADAEAGGPVGSILVDLEAAADFNILVTSTKGGVADEVNASTNGWGVDNQNINDDETITFSFVDDGDGTAFGISDFKFQVTKWTGGFNGAIAITIAYIDADTLGEETETIQFASVEDAVVQITGLTWLDYEAGDLLLDVQVEHGDASTGGGFNLNGVEVGTESSTPPEDLTFDGIIVEVVDSDGDTDSQEFSVFIDGEAGDQLTVEAIAGTSGDDMLNGTSGEDALIAGAGNDILSGGEGDDVLTGGLGVDTFVFSMMTDSGDDVITDFEIGTDLLSFVDVVDDNSSGDIDLGDVISNVVDVGGNITLSLTNGGSITLQGLGDGTVNDVGALQTLLGVDNIQVDPS